MLCFVLLQVVWGAGPSKAISPTTWSESNTVTKIVNLTCYEEVVDQQSTNVIIAMAVEKLFDKLTCNDVTMKSIMMFRLSDLVSFKGGGGVVDFFGNNF